MFSPPRRRFIVELEIPMQNQYRALVVDDDHSTRRLLVGLLKSAGVHDVKEAGNGQAALDLLQAGDAEFDVLFMDREMPVMNGIDAIRAVREAGHQMPILMVTGASQMDQVQEAIDAGVSDYLVKPFLPDAFAQKVNRLFRRLEIRRLGSAFRVKHAMTANVTSVRADLLARDAARLLLERQISGLPVVDAANHVVGILTELELVRLLFSPEIGSVTVGDVMSTNVVFVNEETLLTDAAQFIVEHKMRHLPVVRGGELVGVVARRDLIRFALENRENLERIAEIARLEAAESISPSVADASC
jgi:two-component system chemotaxis response regulator CheY